MSAQLSRRCNGSWSDEGARPPARNACGHERTGERLLGSRGGCSAWDWKPQGQGSAPWPHGEGRPEGAGLSDVHLCSQHVCDVELIRSCAATTQWARAIALLGKDLRSGRTADASVYRSVIEVCGRGRRHVEVRNLLVDMRRRDLWPDTATYGVALRASEHGQEWMQSLRILDDLRRASIIPDREAYGAAISACEKAGQSNRVLSLRAEQPQAQQAAVNPQGSSDGQQWTDAMQVLTSIKHRQGNELGAALLAQLKGEVVGRDGGAALLAQLKGNAEAPLVPDMQRKKGNKISNSLKVLPEAPSCVGVEVHSVTPSPQQVVGTAVTNNNQWLEAMQFLSHIKQRGNQQRCPGTSQCVYSDSVNAIFRHQEGADLERSPAGPQAGAQEHDLADWLGRVAPNASVSQAKSAPSTGWDKGTDVSWLDDRSSSWSDNRSSGRWHEPNGGVCKKDDADWSREGQRWNSSSKHCGNSAEAWESYRRVTSADGRDECREGESREADSLRAPRAGRLQVSSPAVVSVRRSSKGYAVVILRDERVLERSVLQGVAVVDGVCVEVRRHSRSSLPSDAEQPMGLFIAWGHRVERRVTVSEEGLEAYFNRLASNPRPMGLEPKPPFEEQPVSFNILSSLPAPSQLPSPSPMLADAELLLGGVWCEDRLVRNLWAAKDRLRMLWAKPPPPMARGVLNRVARAQLFPHSGERGERDGGRDLSDWDAAGGGRGKKDEVSHENRAGDKLAELAEYVGLLDGVPPGSPFLDLCGGPGAWSRFLLSQEDLQLRGFGFTLQAGDDPAARVGADDWHAQERDQWYPDLLCHDSWRALRGADGTGDLLKPGNLESVVGVLEKQRVLLCLADGGFSDESIPPNQLELYFYRLFLAELLTAGLCLQPGGRFVCKLYTTFSEATAALLYLAARLFTSVRLIKPKRSRVTGPERYLVAFGFRGGEEAAVICEALSRSHSAAGSESPLVVPLLSPVVPSELLARDRSFVESMKAMTSACCRRQTQALNAVVDRAEYLESVSMLAAVDMNIPMQ